MQDNEVMFIGFADNRIPEFKEVRSKDWILFGEDNLFPDHILYLFNKSSNHSAIINGKVKYIIGKGIQENPVVNPEGETLNKILKKACFDIELDGGFYLQFVWKLGGKADVTHVPFQHLRKAKDGTGYFYCKDWNWNRTKKVDPVFIPNYDPLKKIGAAIFCYREYRPGCGEYPLPGYFGALNDIETDVEISKYNLSVIKNGMFSSKMIIFNTGTPTDEVKKKLEKDFKNKFAGSENSGRFMLVFNSDPTKAPIVQDLSTTDLDKLFDQLNKTTQGEIFTGHEITSPMLFGIKTEGQLGGRDEIDTAYEIFKNTYAIHKQEALEEVLTFLAPALGITPGQKFVPLPPLEIAQGLPQITPEGMVNENIKGLSGKENQNLMRIVRNYKKGQISKSVAETMLGKGFGLSTDDIANFLTFAKVEREEEIAEMFSIVGEPKHKYVLLKSREAKFGNGFEKEFFNDIKGNDSAILDLIRKDKRITPEVIAKTINESIEYVRARIGALEDKGVLTKQSQTIGVDTIIEHAINTEQIDTRERPETVDVFIRYSYEAKPGLQEIIETTRPFCKRLIELDRIYTRAEIESISQRVGFSVFDRKGGFWGDSEECRHRWVSHIIIKKR